MKKTARQIGFLFLATASLIANGQTNQTYNGNFNSINFRGTALYSYYEDNSQQRIFEGPFSFKVANGGATISGNYKNSQKNGLWKINLTNVANTDIVMKYSITASSSGSFENGNLEGPWTLNRTKVISFAESGISSYYKSSLNVMSYLFDGKTVDFSKSSTVTESSTANFKNNRFTGNFSYSVNGGKSKVTGQFDENGYFTGTWSITYYQTGILISQTKTYQNGVLMTVKSKDNSTGDITTIYDKSVEVSEFFQNYNEEENYSKVGNRYLMLTEGKSNSDDDKFLEDAITVWYNNTSLAKSAYAFEIEKGSNPMTVFPERVIAYNEKKTELEEEKEKAKERLEQAKRQQVKELEYERQRKIREFQSSDYGRLQEDVKKELNVWLTKSDFETATDFDNRIKSEGASILTSTINKNAEKSKQRVMRRQSAVLQQYNIDQQTFDVLIRKRNYSSNEVQYDTLTISIPKELAPQVYEKFSYTNNRDEYSIMIVPQAVEMVNNYWTVTSALILFDGFWTPRCSAISKDNYKLINNKGNYTAEYDHYGPQKYKLINLKNFAGSLQREVYFYEWKSEKIQPVQPLNFSFEDLNIVLSK